MKKRTGLGTALSRVGVSPEEKPLQEQKDLPFPSNGLHVDKEHPMHVVFVDRTRALFVIDSKKTKKYWLFDTEKREFRLAEKWDLHPIATQFSTPEQTEQTNFYSIEDAAFMAIGVRWRDQVVSLTSAIEYSENQKLKEGMATVIRDLNHGLHLLEQMRNPSLSSEDQLNCRKQLINFILHSGN